MPPTDKVVAYHPDYPASNVELARSAYEELYQPSGWLIAQDVQDTEEG